MPKSRGDRTPRPAGRQSGRGANHPNGRRLDPCPQGISKHNMRAISAPYNFVPLANWVHIPEWSAQVSHDWPFADGLSGEIHYRLVADSPILVGGAQKRSSKTAPGEVTPFQLPDGRYAIPGSSLKGMLRAIVEIAGFGRMRMVDEQCPGLRDISGRFVKNAYMNRVKNVHPGFLQQRDEEVVIIPCQMTRLNHRDLERALDIHGPIFIKGSNVKEKYETWRQLCGGKGCNLDEIRFDPGTPDAGNLFQGANTGTPVFTGQISDSTKSNGKQRDFIFYASQQNNAITVSDPDWRDFLRVHGDQDGKLGMSWPGYWKSRFRRGDSVPVVYIKEGDKLRIGLAFLPKLAGDFSTLDMIDHATPEHLHAPGVRDGYDLADLLFGAVGENQDDALRGRVSCEAAILDSHAEPEQQPATILNGPKPSYFPNYVTQKSDTSGLKLAGGQYATYIETAESQRPTLRGFKRYPARPPELTHVQRLTSEQIHNKKVQVGLHTLRADARFSGRIIFHNLTPEELGALLWALTLDGNPRLRHGVGMGKPFGFGQAHIEIDADRSNAAPNDPTQGYATLTEDNQQRYRGLFKEHMEQAAQPHGGWRASPQIANLLAMADPEAARALPAGMELRHMLLMRCEDRGGKRQNLNEFVLAKQQPPGPFVLADYATVTQHGTPASGSSISGDASSGGGGSARHPWLRGQIRHIQHENNIPERTVQDVWGGKVLAKAWGDIKDASVKSAVLEEIRAYWQAKVWWDHPPKGAKRRAREIYGQWTDGPTS